MTLTDTRPTGQVRVGPPGAVGKLRLLSAPPDSSLAAHLVHWGPLEHPDDLIAEVGRAGLRGRGGAGFPTARKLNAVRHEANGRRRAVVVANGAEGEPASAKDGVLLTVNPHLVLDGMVAAARAVGASRSILCVKEDDQELVGSLSSAVAERADTPVSIEVVTVPSRYIVGEESALMNWLNNRRAVPLAGLLRPAQRGVHQKPTLVDNVETLANVGLIARFGASWWRRLGTPQDPGSVLVTVSGGVDRPGVMEVAQGTALADVLARASARPALGVLVGGYFGTWLSPPDATSALLSASDLAGRGAGLGCGVVAVIAEGTCPLVEVAGVSRWLAGQSAGQCGPCANGLPTVTAALDELVAGRAGPGAGERIAHWSAMIRGRGACKLPDGAVAFVQSAVTVFADHIEAHRLRGPCPAGEQVLPTPTMVIDR